MSDPNIGDEADAESSDLVSAVEALEMLPDEDEFEAELEY
jgi:hypothetical protein